MPGKRGTGYSFGKKDGDKGSDLVIRSECQKRLGTLKVLKRSELYNEKNTHEGKERYEDKGQKQ